MGDRVNFEFGATLTGLGVGKMTDSRGNSLDHTGLSCSHGPHQEVSIMERMKINQDINMSMPLVSPISVSLETVGDLKSPLENACERLANKAPARHK